MDTIFALSSGQPPAGIAVLRVSGPRAGTALEAVACTLPEPRHASLRALRDMAGTVIDHALVLWFPGPGSTTGEDLAEFHIHGGRAVVAALEAALGGIEGLRRAEPGEFTRRAFANGRLDLAQAEGLADLLAAETELQRLAAMEMAGGALSRAVEQWREQLLALSAEVEAALDFEDEDDVATLNVDFVNQINELRQEIAARVAAPRAELLREGFRVVLAGPPNAGKSTLFNALTESEAAITAPTEGTTRDVLVRPVAISGVPFSFVDTAGLRPPGADEIEAIGISRAKGELGRADVVLWLGPEGAGPEHAWEIEPMIDRADHVEKPGANHKVSAVTGQGLAELKLALVEHAREAMPKPGEAALNARQRALLGDAAQALAAADGRDDPLLVAEQLRLARLAFDRLTGRAATEDMLDALFGRYCIGK